MTDAVMLRIEKAHLLLFSLSSPPQAEKHTSLPFHQLNHHFQFAAPCSSQESDIMDFDFDFRATIPSAKYLSAAQVARFHSDNYSVIHSIDVENDDGSDFRCPFCDFEIQGPLLCNDLEEDYWSGQKNVVCPVCEGNLGKDAITELSHSSSQKSEKSSIWSGISAGKKSAARGNKQESIPDPLLSPFVCNIPIPNRNSIHPDENSSPRNNNIDIHDAKSYGTDAADAVVEEDQQEQGLRAAFVQKLILSTIFEET